MAIRSGKRNGESQVGRALEPHEGSGAMKFSAHIDRVLVVDDSPETLELIARKLINAGMTVSTADSVDSAIDLLLQIQFDLVLTDYKMPRVDGFDLIRHVSDNYPETGIVMITGFPSIEGAVRAIKVGAGEYLAKPFTDSELFAALERVAKVMAARRAGRSAVFEDPAACGLVGASPAMEKVFTLIRKASSVDATVLITGESGTGKELVARAIHYGSSRASATFVPVNCAAIPETLLESELFGYVKGAFTGAVETRAGFFLVADGGTIFLDEVCDTSLAMQTKVLRALQEKEVSMVGGGRPRKVDVRILAATNKDPFDMVGKGLFREDLYYRLNVLTIQVPPLRERGDDVMRLFHHFAGKFSKETGRPEPVPSDRVLTTLRGYSWPGNVRELENLVLRLVIMLDGQTIEQSDLPPHMRFAVPPSERELRPLAEMEAEHVRRVLDACGGNRTRAAELLGINRKTLREKLKRAGIDEE